MLNKIFVPIVRGAFFAVLAIAATAALSISALAAPMQAQFIDSQGEKPFTSLSKFRVSRDAIDRLSVSVEAFDYLQRPVQFLLPKGVHSEIIYGENEEQKVVRFVVPAKDLVDGQKQSVDTTYLLFQLDPSVVKGPVRIQHGNRFTDMTADDMGRYTQLTFGQIEGQKVRSVDDEDCDWSCTQELALWYAQMMEAEWAAAVGPACTGLCAWVANIFDCNFVNSCAENSNDMDSCLTCCRGGGGCPLIVKVYLTSPCNANCVARWAG